MREMHAQLFAKYVPFEEAEERKGALYELLDAIKRLRQAIADFAK